MRLLFVAASRNGWGTEQHLVSLAKALADNGHDVAAVTNRGSPVADLLVAEGIRIVAVPFRGGLDPRGIAATVRELRRHRPHWIVTNRAKLYWTVLLLGRLFGGSDSTSNGEQELVVLITPVLVHPLDPHHTRPLPGAEMLEPSDVDFYVRGHLESQRPIDYRSPVRTD